MPRKSVGARRGGDCPPGTICLDAGIQSPEPDVDVESRMELGPYEVAVLSADDVGALRRWLDDNGYLVRPGMEQVLAEYVDPGGGGGCAVTRARRRPSP